MDHRNSYLTYKRDTSQLLHWIINNSNEILRNKKSIEGCPPMTINTTGRSTVAEIVNMSKLIAKYVQPVPSSVFKLLKAVIRARVATHDAFQKIANQTPNSEIEQRNATHRHFIDALTEVLYALGGDLSSSSKKPTPDEDEDDEDSEILKISNMFSVLGSSESQAEDDDHEPPQDDTQSERVLPARKKNATKGKKGRGKKSKSKSASDHTTEPSLAKVPIECYRIIEDEGGLVTDYLLAVHAVVQEWSQLRSYVQNLWREVAYEGLNGAVAAPLTNIAVNMVKQTCLSVFVDFPGHESYETMVKTLTRGNPDRDQAQFSISFYSMSEGSKQYEKIEEGSIDVKEQFWIHAFNDMVTFVTDFQQNRTGLPTKKMQAHLKSWDPNLDLQSATKDERIAWRRSYTINWLYDLVNLTSSVVVQRNKLLHEHHVYENVDWSKTGPWYQHRRLFGLSEFAGTMTTLAMQPPNVDIRQKILPHHVFQLQCIVDSLMISRGWATSPLRGHVVKPPAHNFYPRRDVDLFLDRESKREFKGFLKAAHILRLMLEEDSRIKEISPLLHEVGLEFINGLGESKYKHGLNAIPPSRFSKHNSNGLWDFSPLLCATGMVEGLVLAQRVAMLLWDHLPEPMLALHLHNMLVQMGYLEKPVELYKTLEAMLSESIFPDGVPTSDFTGALGKQMMACQDPGLTRLRQVMARDPSKDIHQLLDVSSNRIYKTKTTLMMHYDADWIPDRIPDSAVRIPSALHVARLGNTKRVIDPVSGNKRLEETELVKRIKAKGPDDAMCLKLASFPDVISNIDNEDAMMHRVVVHEGDKPSPQLDPDQVKEMKEFHTQGCDLLNVIRYDLFADVCGKKPMSSLNYIIITVHLMILFNEFEDRLRQTRHPLFIRLYEHLESQPTSIKRAVLIGKVIVDRDDEALKLFAEVFESLRMGTDACVFWDKLPQEEDGSKKGPAPVSEEIPGDACSVM